MKINTEKVLFTELGDEGVVYLVDTNEYLSLNETMYAILKAVEQGKDIPAIVEALCETYAIDAPTCQTAVENSLRAFVEKQIITE